MEPVRPDSAETMRLLTNIENGDRQAFDQLMERHRPVLRMAVKQRLSTKVQARVDPSDVVQEAQTDAFQRLDDYLTRRPMPFRLWLLKTAHERLLKIERKHLQTARRAIDREVPLPDRSSMNFARGLVNRGRSPLEEATMKDLAAKVRRILARLSEPDREIIMLRNFTGLSNSEASCVLEIKPETGKKRYTRALLRLQVLLEEEGLTGSSL